MRNECAIVQDLIPLVNDGVASPESKDFVFEHCKHCDICKALLNQPPIYNEEKITKKFQKQVFFTKIFFLFFMILFACSLSATFNQFNNFIIIPFIGGLGYALLKKQVYLLYLAIPICHLLIEQFSQDGDYLLFYTVLYWIFMTLGIAIYQLYHYAFKGSDKK